MLRDISTQLLCERRNDSHSQSLAFGQVEVARQSDPVVTHRDLKSVRVQPGKAYPDVSVGPIRKGILGGVRDKLVNNQSYRNRSIGIEDKSPSSIDNELAPRGGANHVGADLLQVRAEVDLLDVRVIG